MGKKKNKKLPLLKHEGPKAEKRDKRRLKYGFSDVDAWNADGHLARIIGNMLLYLAKNSGCPSRFMPVKDGIFDDTPEASKAGFALYRREYRKHAGVFLAYAEGDAWDTQELVDKWGGALQSDLDESLAWFAEHFQEFWD